MSTIILEGVYSIMDFNKVRIASMVLEKIEPLHDFEVFHPELPESIHMGLACLKINNDR